MSEPTDFPLDYRLMLSAREFALGDATLAALTRVRNRDEDTPITPETDAKKPRLIIAVQDLGRTMPYAPIRSMRIEFAIRANAKVPQGQADEFATLCGALETRLDTTNLKTSLDAPAQGVRVMLAVRSSGFIHRVEGDIRSQTYVVDVRAVGTEHCT